MAIRNYVRNPAEENNYFVSDYSFLSGSENQNMAVRNEKKKITQVISTNGYDMYSWEITK